VRIVCKGSVVQCTMASYCKIASISVVEVWNRLRDLGYTRRILEVPEGLWDGIRNLGFLVMQVGLQAYYLAGTL